MHAVAGLTVDGLRHQSGRHTVRGGRIADDVFCGHRGVCQTGHLAQLDLDLQLAGAADLMVVILDVHAPLGKLQTDLVAQVKRAVAGQIGVVAIVRAGVKAVVREFPGGPDGLAALQAVADGIRAQGARHAVKDMEFILRSDDHLVRDNQINEIDHKAESVMAQCRELEKAVESFKEKMAAAKANNIMTGIKHIGEISLITAQVDGMGADEMKSMADKIKAEVPNSVAVMGAETDGKITFVAMASKEAVKLGVHCGKIIKDITAVAGGRGGGKPDMAQGGGSDASKIDDALAKVDEIVAEQIK